MFTFFSFMNSGLSSLAITERFRSVLSMQLWCATLLSLFVLYVSFHHIYPNPSYLISRYHVAPPVGNDEHFRSGIHHEDKLKCN